MEKAKICAKSHSNHVLPHWKCVLRCCAQCPNNNIPDHETDDNHPKPSPSIIFHIYHMIARCKKHGRITLSNKKSCQECQQDTASAK